MKKILIASLLSFVLVVPSTAALAGGYGHGGHGGYGYKGGGYGYGGHDYGDEILIGAGIIGGSILLGSWLSRPYYYQPAPTYYQPAPTCYQDEVWRRLPDDRIQTGVRTRCYQAGPGAGSQYPQVLPVSTAQLAPSFLNVIV